MRDTHSPLVLRSFRLVAVMGIGIWSLQAAPAYANPPAPAPAPTSATPVTTTPVTTTEVATPREGVAVVVNTTTTTAPAPAAPAAYSAPAVVVAPVPAPSPVAAEAAVDPAPTDVERAPMPNPMAERRRQREAQKGRAAGLAAAGWSILGSSYLLSALIGTITLDTTQSRQMRRFGGWMTVPLVGPIGAAFNTRTATGALFTTTMGLVQAAGFTMAVVGTSRHRRAKRDLRLMAMPSHGGGHVGLSMRF